MNASDRRQYEMLLRLRDFGDTHRDLFAASTVGQKAFASLGAAITELTATDLLKMSAWVSARADRKRMARKALIELLVKASQLARVLRAEGQTVPPFALPASKSAQVLLTTARQFARDAQSNDAEFSGHGVGPTHIADTAASFETAVRDRDMKRADHIAARTRIRDLLAAALLKARRLDLIVHHELADNNAIRAVWKQARRVENPRRRTFAATEAIGEPSRSPVTEMPARQAA